MKKLLSAIKRALYFWVARYFGFWADIVLRRWQPRTIVITGSSGKTTLQNMLAFQLSHSAIVSGKANSTFGIPFQLLDLPGTQGKRSNWVLNLLRAPIQAFRVSHHQRYYLAEADASLPGEGAFLAKLLRPMATIWVSSGKTHSEDFDRLVDKKRYSDVESAIAAEFAHYASMTSRLVLADGDNEHIASAMQRFDDWLQLEKKEVLLDKYAVDAKKTSFMLTNKRIYRFAGPQPRRLGYQVVMMDKLLTSMKREPKLDMTSMSQPPGRSTIFSGIRETTLLDSSYNANLDSMVVMLELFADLPGAKKVLVLGDMLEQGKQAAGEHRTLAKAIIAMKLHPSQIVLLGPLTARHTAPLLTEEYGDRVSTFASSKSVLDHLKKTITGGEFILFKGSQGQLLDGVIQHLLADASDAQKLPRRSAYWDRQRRKIGL